MPQEVDYKQPIRPSAGKSYWVELIVTGKPVRIPAANILSVEGLIGMVSCMVALNFPNVSGFNILSEDQSTLLHEVHPMGLMMAAAPTIQQITGQQNLKAAVPIVASQNSEAEFKKMVADAKVRGKIIE